MIERIIKLSIKRRFIVLLFVAAMAIAGVISLRNLPIDAVPDITNVQVQIITSAPALAPVEIERQVTFPVETALSGLPGVTDVRSISKFAMSVVTVVFDENVDTYFARQLVLERLAKVREQIPESVGQPQMGPISTGLGEIYQYEVRSKKGLSQNRQDLRTEQDWNVRRQLMGVPGVAEVNSYGGEKKQYQVRLDPQRLYSYGLTLRDVLDAVVRNNENVGGAYIEHGSEQYILRGIGLTRSASQIENIVVKAGKEGVPVYIRDVGEVVEGSEVRQGAVLADGKGEIVAGIVMMLKGENSRAVVERVKERVAQVQKTLPSDVELVPFYDRSQLVDKTVHTIETNLVEGASLVVVVLLLVLGNLRGSILVASVIPLSMLFAAICMSVFKVSGNLMSLGAIDFGLIVDGAVVVVENVVRRLSQAHPNIGHEERMKQIAKACLEVGRPVVFAVAIITIVYLPILSLFGVEGKMFKPMALTIVFALIGSLILSLTYVPAMLTLVMNGPVPKEDSFIVHIMRELYSRALNVVMKFRAQTFTIALALLSLSFMTFPLLGSEFIPRLDEGALAVQMQQLPSISLTQSIANATNAEKILKSFPEVTRVVSKIGRAELATDPMGVETADIYVGLKPREELPAGFNREELIARMKKQLERGVPQAVFSFSQPVELRTSELIAGVRSEVAIKIFGDDIDQLKASAEQIAKVVSGVIGAADVKVEQVSGLPQLIVTPDRAAIARYGINVEDVNNVVASLVAGKNAGVVYEGEKRFDLTVRLQERSAKDINEIKNLLISAPSGARIPLSELASVTVKEGPAQISREDRRRRIVVEMNVRGRDLGSFVQDAQAQIEKNVSLPAGYYVTYGGQFENLHRATNTLMIVVPLALFSIFVLLFLTFGSFSQALLIFTGIPFAIIGGIFALAARGMPFSISAGIGFIALSGVAVLNGVVLVSYINKLKTKMETELAVREGAMTRFRPVLMTALVASLGFVPMAFSASAGAEVQRPLATVVIGGLISSSLLTLLLLPDLYLWFEKISLKLGRAPRRKREPIDVSKIS